MGGLIECGLVVGERHVLFGHSEHGDRWLCGAEDCDVAKPLGTSQEHPNRYACQHVQQVVLEAFKKNSPELFPPQFSDPAPTLEVDSRPKNDVAKNAKLSLKSLMWIISLAIIPALIAAAKSNRAIPEMAFLKEIKNSPILKSIVIASLGFFLGCINRSAVPFCFNYEIIYTGQYNKKLPEKVYLYAEWIRKIIVFKPNLAVNAISLMVIHAPITEEAIFRLGLQHVVLKRLLAKIFAGGVTDHKAIACARIIFAAIAFALAHVHREEEYYLLTRLSSTLICGLLAGTIQETTNNTAYSILFHTMWNLMPAICKHEIKGKVVQKI